MRKTNLAAALAAGALLAASLTAALQGATAAPSGRSDAAAYVVTGSKHVCPAPKPGVAACLAEAATNVYGKIITSTHPLASAFTPAMIQQAYRVTGKKSGGATVAIVDAYGYPTLASDLAQFRSEYDLPACTTKNGCLKIEGQDGGAPPGGSDQDWDLEQALDVDMVSAICPDCKILMIEATSDFDAAENLAAKTKGVVAISNSYVDGNVGNDPAYEHKGIAITAGTGDWGYEGGDYPASDTYVTAVGGTSLYAASGTKRGYTESTWSGTGSGCGINPVGKWQKKIDTSCSTKANSDVSAAADPGNGGLNVYDSQYGGWIQVGGTSEATPLIAGIYALSGNTKGWAVSIPYKAKSKKHLYDIKTGSNGTCGSPLCDAGKGWDGPTGLGTPKGVRAF